MVDTDNKRLNRLFSGLMATILFCLFQAGAFVWYLSELHLQVNQHQIFVERNANVCYKIDVMEKQIYEYKNVPQNIATLTERIDGLREKIDNMDKNLQKLVNKSYVN